MGYEPPVSSRPALVDPAAAAERSFRLDHRTIFRELIAQELRAGRLNRSARKRIVQYAAQLGLTAVESGDMIAECRDAALLSPDAQEREFALRLVSAPDLDWNRLFRSTAVMGAVVLAVCVFIRLLPSAWPL